MTILHSEFKKFLQLLIEHDTKFLVIGGFAVSLYGYIRYTGDIDIWIEPNQANAQKVLKAIDAFGFEIEHLQSLDFEIEPVIFHMGKEPVKIDITTHIAGVKFEACYPHRVEIIIDDLSLPFISLEDLKVNKKRSGRLKDLNDLEHLP